MRGYLKYTDEEVNRTNILNKSCECALNSKSIEALYVNDNKLVAMTNGGRPYVINKYKDEETAQMAMEFLISEIKE